MSQVHYRMGLFAWLILGGAIATIVVRLPTDRVKKAMDAFSATLVDRSQTFHAVDRSGSLQVGDPVFTCLVEDKQTLRWQQVGHVQRVNQNQLTISWQAESAPRTHRFRVHRQSGSLQAVIATMLPPEKRERIRQRLESAMNQHGEEIAASLAPLVRESVEKSLPVIETELRASIARHKPEIGQLTQTWNQELVQQHLIPLAKTEILPIVRLHTQPEVEAIGRELWDRASLWRFGWRAIYDKTPLPQQDLVREEWGRFVEEEAIPVFEAHTDELVVVLQETLRDAAMNPQVREGLHKVTVQIANNPQAQDLIKQILKETLLENPALRNTWRDVWTSHRAEARLRAIGDRIEPIVREIGDELFGTHKAGIDPQFARVLRSQILGKDRRWIQASPRGLNPGPEAFQGQRPERDPPPIEIVPAMDSLTYPVIYLATEDR